MKFDEFLILILCTILCASILNGMAAALNRKIARQTALRVLFERHIAEVKTSLTDPESTQANFLV